MASLLTRCVALERIDGRGEGGEAYASSVHTAKLELGGKSESSDELTRLYRRRSGRSEEQLLLPHWVRRCGRAVRVARAVTTSVGEQVEREREKHTLRRRCPEREVRACSADRLRSARSPRNRRRPLWRSRRRRRSTRRGEPATGSRACTGRLLPVRSTPHPLHGSAPPSVPQEAVAARRGAGLPTAACARGYHRRGRAPLRTRCARRGARSR